jgi:hypothetical protein
MGARLLVLEAGYAASNNLARSLKAGDPSLTLVGCNRNRYFLKKFPGERRYLLPFSTPAYGAALREIVKAERIDLIIPTTDSDVRRIGMLRAKLGCRTFLPSNALIRRCQDKYALTMFLRERRIPAPLTYPLTSIESITGVFNRFPADAKLWCRIRAGAGSYGAIPAKTPAQVRGWVAFWEEMRGVEAEAFTLSEYLPGRDYGVQCLWDKGTLVLAKMAERITYLDTGSPSGRSSMPAVAKTVYASRVMEVCIAAIQALDPRASGVFFIDLKENAQGEPCITEINAGRFATMTNIYDLTGKHNMAATYVRLALGKPARVAHPFDFAQDCYFVRSVDTLPAVMRERDLYRGIKELSV